MKRHWLAVCVLGVFASGLALAENEPAQPEKAKSTEGKPLKSVFERGSYAFGFNMGRNLASQGIEIDAKIFARGMADALAKQKGLLDDDELETAMQEFQMELRKKVAERQKEMAEKGVAFLEANKKKKGVVTLKSGLQYEVIKEGTGATPKETDTVTTHYHGTLVDGTVFDSSVDRNEPASFPVNMVIAGWTEALQLMKVGSKWRLFIPSKLAYGEDGRPPKIAPNSVLIFEVELIKIGE